MLTFLSKEWNRETKFPIDITTRVLKVFYLYNAQREITINIVLEKDYKDKSIGSTYLYWFSKVFILL